jgi:hypothetical protein
MWHKLQHWKVMATGKVQKWGADWKDTAATVQSIVTIIALLVGGIWTYRTFVQFRQDRPKLVITHSVSHFFIPNRLILLSVEEKYSNVGPVKIDLTKGDIRIVRLLPLPDGLEQRVKNPDSLKDSEDPNVLPVIQYYPHPWDEKRKFIEPGESDTVQNYLLIPDSTEIVDIKSYAGNRSEGNKMAWHCSTTYDMRPQSATMPARPEDAPSRGTQVSGPPN